MSRHRPYLIWFGVAVALTLFVAVALVPRSAWVALDQRRSSLRVTPDGVAAWARSLEVLGVPVVPRFTDYETEPPRGRGEVLLEPMVPPSAGEVHTLLEWVRAGGVLVYSPRFEPLADSLWVDFTLRETDPFEPVQTRDSLLAHPWSEGPIGWNARPAWSMHVDPKRAPDLVPLAELADGGTTLAWLPMGGGGVLLIAEAEEMANRSLDESEIAVTATRAVVDLLAGDTLYFSEYHQGMSGGRGLFRESVGLAAGLPLGRVFLIAIVAGAGLLLVGGRRFGAPLPPPPGPRRSTVEHVDAVARIYRAARAERTVAHYLVRSAARRMRLAPSAALAEQELLASLASRPALAEPAHAAAAALASDPPDLSTLQRALDTLVARHNAVRTTS